MGSASQDVSGDWRSHIPETPLLVAAVIGGPLAVGSTTPFRNCLALASQDSTSPARALWRQVLSGGFSTAYKGGLAPVPASVIQFAAVGPLYHIFASVAGPVVGVVCSSAAETAVIFGPEGRNVQLAFNQSVAAERKVAMRSYLKPWGPGVLALLGRNLVANSGIRVLSEPMTNVVQGTCETVGVASGAASCKVAGDFLSSLITGACSMPFNQTFYFCSTSKELQETTSLSARQGLILKFLRSQYLTESGGISKNMLRDLSIRATYIGVLFSIFAGVERTCLTYMK